jgi:hypothetical protein
MRVEAGFVNHPKFVRLKKAVGDYAMEAVIRLWGHCEFGQKGEYWRGADADFIETVAGWVGEPGKLFAALVEAKLIVIELNGVRVNDWNHHNSRTVANWKLGRRPKRSQGQAMDEPRLNHGSAKAEPWPSRMYVCKDVGKDDDHSEENNNGAPPDDLKAQYAALKDLIEKMKPRRKEFTPQERAEYAELKKNSRRCSGDKLDLANL